MRTTTCRFFLSLFIISILASCKGEKKEPVTEQKTENQDYTLNPYKDAKITMEVFKVDSAEINGMRGYGYNIFIDGKIYLHQPNIPAIMGNNGFSSEEKAKKAGAFVISKIKNNVIPPAVTPEELDSLDVLN